MYEIFEKLCSERNVTPYRVSKETGVTTATLTSWKQGKYEPKKEKLMKIAEYFDVSLEYLMTGKEDRLSDADALLDVQISEDAQLKEAIKKYYALDDQKKKHVIR